MKPGPESPDGEISPEEPTEYIPGEDEPHAHAANKPDMRSTPIASQASPEADFTLGEDVSLGEFRLLRRLGRGGMSEVYLAEQTLLKRYVAIKVLRPELMVDDSLRQRFQKEALAVAGLNHPNIVQVYTVGEADGRYYIAQEYVNGQNLREYLTRKGPPDLPVAVHIMKQVAAALQAAATAGIVHRDIKPENIMLAKKGEVKVADFGLAKRNDSPESQQLTQIGTTMGTPLYMSPEQINGSEVDQRCDLYSFGITCYHMLAGKPPFRGDNAIAIAVQHLKTAPRPLEKIRPDLPPLLCRIVHKLMEKDPDQRYQSAAAVIKDLKRVAQEKHQGANARPSEDRPVVSRSSSALIPTVTSWLKNPAQAALTLADRPWPAQWPRLLVTAIVMALVGAGIGWMRRPVNPLLLPPASGARGGAQSVPHKETARDQWFQATLRPTDVAAWEAVVKRFPDDKVYTPQAMIELGLLQIADNQLDAAQVYFDRLAAYGDLHAEWQAAGWMGQALILHQRKQYDQSQQLLREKGEQLQKSLPPVLREYGRRTVQSNATHLQQGIDDKLTRIFEE